MSWKSWKTLVVIAVVLVLISVAYFIYIAMLPVHTEQTEVVSKRTASELYGNGEGYQTVESIQGSTRRRRRCALL